MDEIKPVCICGGMALWYSPDDRGFYWQSDSGWGNATSKIYKSYESAMRAYSRGKIKLQEPTQ